MGGRGQDILDTDRIMNPDGPTRYSHWTPYLISDPVLRYLLPLAAAVVLAACDSGPAVDPPSPADIAGTYTVTEFRFRPDASGITPVNLLDTLAAASFEVLDSGDAFLRYRFRGGNERVLLGEVEVRRDQIRLTFDAGTEANRTRLLLPSSLVFDRVDEGFDASTETTVNLEAYDASRYQGLDEAAGRLLLSLAPVPDET